MRSAVTVSSAVGLRNRWATQALGAHTSHTPQGAPWSFFVAKVVHELEHAAGAPLGEPVAGLQLPESMLSLRFVCRLPVDLPSSHRFIGVDFCAPVEPQLLQYLWEQVGVDGRALAEGCRRPWAVREQLERFGHESDVGIVAL